MIHPDKEIWDKIKLNTERYEYVPIPTAIWRILKPKVGNKVLLCHYVHKDEWGKCLDTDTERILVMHYVSYDGYHAEQYGGYSFTHYLKDEKLKDTLIRVAESIALDWPEFAVKHRKKNARDTNQS